MHVAHPSGLNCEDTQYFGHQTVGIVLEVLTVVFEHTQEQVKLMLSHGLDNKSLIMAEEEETTTATGTCSRFEHLVKVQTWLEGSFQSII
jgi:hypothetical protein